MFSSESYLLFRNVKHVKSKVDLLSPVNQFGYSNDDTDNYSEILDEENNSSGTEFGMLNLEKLSIRSKRYTHHKKRPSVKDLKFTSPISSPLFANPYQLRNSEPTSPFNKSPSKSMALFDNRDISTSPSNITLEFNTNQDLVYISPCVLQLLGYDAASLVESNTPLFTQLPSFPSNKSTLNYTTISDPEHRIHQIHQSKDIYTAANTLLQQGGINSISITYKAIDAGGTTCSMEGQGMLLSQYGKSSMVWVTRIINHGTDLVTPLSRTRTSLPTQSLLTPNRRTSDEPQSIKSNIGSEGWGRESVDVLNDLGLCHICERSIPVTLFGGHSKVCSAAHHAGIILFDGIL